MTPGRPMVPGIALALAFASVSGCGLEKRGPNGTVNTCSVDAECGDGEMCGPEGICLSEDGTPLRLALAISVPGATVEGETLRYATPLFDYEPGNTGPVTLPRPVTVVGQVRTAAGRRVRAELFFTRQGIDVPEVGRLVRASTFTDAQDVPGFAAPMDFTVQLTEGVDYAIVVEPRGDDLYALPPLRIPPEAFAPGDTGAVGRDLVYPDVDLGSLTGRVVGPHGEPVDCVEVQAISRATGLRVSSVSRSGGCPETPEEAPIEDLPPGGYALAVDPTASDVLLRLVPPDPLPVLTFDPKYAAPDFETVVALPELPEVTYGARVEDVAGVPQGNAIVTFRASAIESEIAGTVGAVEATVRTDDAGEFELTLFAGDYQVIAQAASGARGGVLVQDVSIGVGMTGAPIRGQVFILPERATLEGMLTTSSGEPVRGTRVEARPLNSTAPVDEVEIFSPSAAFNRSAVPQETDDLGAFSLRLDEGSYDLVLEPAAGSGFPWQRVRQSVGPGAGEVQVELVVPAPVSFRGTVRDHDGLPVVAAQVSAYGEVSDDLGTRLIPIGVATTDADGVYELLLPPGL